MNNEIDPEVLHRAELLHYLSDEEMTLPDVDREALLLERKLLDSGALREQDLIGNRAWIREQAIKEAKERNRIRPRLSERFEALPPWAAVLVYFLIGVPAYLTIEWLVKLIF